MWAESWRYFRPNFGVSSFPGKMLVLVLSNFSCVLLVVFAGVGGLVSARRGCSGLCLWRDVFRHG